MSQFVPWQWHSYHLPKRGHQAGEYEDAFAGSPARGRFAVADGASESSFSGLWAQLLVEGFVVPDESVGSVAEGFKALQKRWAAAVDGRELPWYAEEKREQGAFATFLGLTLRRAENAEGQGSWKARAVGDSCLFQVRNERLIQAFPLTNANEFGNQPSLLGSRPTGEPAWVKQQKQAYGKWRVGDRLLLMTDALAQWFLARHESGEKPWQAVSRLRSDSSPEKAFAVWIEELRAKQSLRNDDVTLLVVDFLVTKCDELTKD
jgi:hypothetical protein